MSVIKDGIGKILKKAVMFFAVLAVLMLLVASHEMGHLTMMEQNNVAVEEISIGIGWPLYQTALGNSTASLRLIMLGGYVIPADNEQLEAISSLGKISIAIAGPAVNFLTLVTAFGLIYCIYFWRGVKSLRYLIELPARTGLAIIGLSFSAILRKPVFSELIILPRVITNQTFGKKLISWGIALNILLLWFNTLPIFPLDGGRVFIELLYLVGAPARIILSVMTASFYMLFALIIFLNLSARLEHAKFKFIRWE